MAKLSQSVGESHLRDKLCRLDQARREPEFHRDSESATAEIPESDRLVKTLSRLDQLHENVETLKGSVYEG